MLALPKPTGQRTTAHQRSLLVSIVGKPVSIPSCRFTSMPRPASPERSLFPNGMVYSPYQQHAAFHGADRWPGRPRLSPTLSSSGIAYRFPHLKWVFAETRDRLRELRANRLRSRVGRAVQLWRHGLEQRPSELIRKQVVREFLVRASRHRGLDSRLELTTLCGSRTIRNIASTYPESWKFVERSLQGGARGRARKNVVSQCASFISAWVRQIFVEWVSVQTISSLHQRTVARHSCCHPE